MKPTFSPLSILKSIPRRTKSNPSRYRVLYLSKIIIPLLGHALGTVLHFETVRFSYKNISQLLTLIVKNVQYFE